MNLPRSGLVQRSRSEAGQDVGLEGRKWSRLLYLVVSRHLWPDLGTPESYNPNVLQDHNQPLTPTDLETLQGFLLSHGVIGSEQTIERASDECNGFGLFIRSLDGFDRNAQRSGSPSSSTMAPTSDPLHQRDPR